MKKAAINQPKNHNARRPGSRLRKLALFGLVTIVAGCITVNVNFPESAVQRAADDFVRDLYKGTVAENTTPTADHDAAAVKQSVKKTTKKKSEKAAPTKDEPTTWQLEFGVRSAFAQEINTSTPKAQTIKDRMKSRVGAIAKYKQMGAICETSDAMLVLKANKAGAEAGNAAKLVKDENADRDELYVEIQESNKITDRRQTKIRKFFSAAFKENSPAGTCFEN